MGGKSGRNERAAACAEGIIVWRVHRHRERYCADAEAENEAGYFAAAECLAECRGTGSESLAAFRIGRKPGASPLPLPLVVHDKRRCGDSDRSPPPRQRARTTAFRRDTPEHWKAQDRRPERERKRHQGASRQNTPGGEMSRTSSRRVFDLNQEKRDIGKTHVAVCFVPG
jgi:hypothetical protein